MSSTIYILLLLTAVPASDPPSSSHIGWVQGFSQHDTMKHCQEALSDTKKAYGSFVTAACVAARNPDSMNTAEK